MMACRIKKKVKFQNFFKALSFLASGVPTDDNCHLHLKETKSKGLWDYDYENIYVIILYSLLILVLKIMITRWAIDEYNSVAT